MSGFDPGYIFGGIAESIGWRSCFFIEAAVGFVLVLVALLVPNVSLGSQAGSFKEGQAPCIGVDSHSPLQGNVQFLKSHFNVRVIAPCFWKENFPILSNPEDASAKTFSGMQTCTFTVTADGTFPSISTIYNASSRKSAERQ